MIFSKLRSYEGDSIKKEVIEMKLTARYMGPQEFTRAPIMTTELELDPKKLAFLIVDDQNDFLCPGGFFDGYHANIPEARKIIPPTKRVADACRKAGVQVIYTLHAYRPDFSDVGPHRKKALLERSGQIGPGAKVGPPGQLTIESKADPTRFRIKGTWEAAIVDELTPQPGDIVIDDKHQYSGFFQTDLELILRTLGIETIMFGGMTSAICVESTLRDAHFRGFGCIVISDCEWGYYPEIQDASEKLVMVHFGTVTTSEEVLKALATV